jgi:putative FmdB family regulatory protein
MATYEYKCATCGIQIEIQRPMTDSSAAPMCDCGTQMNQVYGSFGLQFKGSGFYSTDSK